MGNPSGRDPALHPPVPVEGDGEELIGAVIDGRYRLESTLGRGGMGLVYKARHATLRRQVAVKILHPSLAASPDVRNRFEREALSVGKIDHPNCVAVYDSGRLADGSLYLAMELLEGKPLSDVLEKEGQIAPGRALHILAHILRGLAHIHQQGLIHRDIKPENIFLIRQGEDVDFAKILDFGIAKPMDKSDLDDGVKLTQAGMAFGTPIYMAPEQALGNKMDGRADLYAAAVIGYELLCGQPPFYSDDKLEVMSMHTARPVPPMRQRLIKHARPVPSSIERLILRGLTKKATERYPTAEVFLGEVEAALHTTDGGQTDVSFEKPASETGRHSLVAHDGQVSLTGPTEFATEEPSEVNELISAAIDEELSVPNRVRAATPATDAKGLPSSVAAAAGRPFGTPTPRAPQGGVGIGLPYTGPTGEPIFGLTPEQRLAQPGAVTMGEDGSRFGSNTSIANALEPDDHARTTLRTKPTSRKRWVLYAAIAALAAAVGVAIALVTARTDEPGGLDPNTPAGMALAALDRGRPGEALKLLEDHADEIAKDGHAQLVLGHAHAARRDSAPSLAAYAQALELEPTLESDPALRANLRAMAADTDLNVVATAFELWAGRTQDPEAKPLLIKAAISGNLDRRHAARPVAEQVGLIDEVDWFIAYAQDLEQEASCGLRKEAVSRLRALNDPRAVAPLERAVVKKFKSGSLRGKPFNSCLIDDAKAAIGYLRGLPPTNPE